MSEPTQEGSLKSVQFKLLNDFDEEIVVDFEDEKTDSLNEDDSKDVSSS